MPVNPSDAKKCFERGVVVLSFDTEQIWGYRDLLKEAQFQAQFPNALDAHEKLLQCLCSAGISATWFVVGGMSLRTSGGARDPRMAGLLPDWTVMVPEGSETTAPLWYRRSFVERLRDALPRQEIGLHGGLIHLIWTDRRATADVVRWELAEGVKALEEVLVRPCSFSFPRDEEAYHEVLRSRGICCYRGRTPVLAFQLGRSLPGAALRILDEVCLATPPPVWPQEVLPGLWNIPSSLFLYSIGPSRARLAPLRLRMERFSRGIDAAIRHQGIFHFCLHPENLVESAHGFSLFEDMVDRLVRARDRGDVEVLTMAEIAGRMESRHETRPAESLLPEKGQESLASASLPVRCLRAEQAPKAPGCTAPHI
jgi:hypothetical protein